MSEKIRVVLRWIQIKDNKEAAWDDEGEFRFQSKSGVELDKMTANGQLEHYSKSFSGDSSGWLGRHQPTDEGIDDPENMSDWRICYDIESA